ncbi:MAG: UDP-N-acetylglucosamine--N-acetylmuramyl-(pentapeptide) pyrophosphoryl-undecaprenol N-acetylglucosamine transferase [Patescibacteria group bacterium]|nr:UDP-N-acetylglucosamine--N-acetylmuramyl-(pentapeptide) pyrophosphoryl-undecaprenol N-acetylglucosamine transferase [Patescibacteria group bacterium]
MPKTIICVTGGSTGGHFFPLLTVSQALFEEARQTGQALEVFYLGGQPLEPKTLLQNNIAVSIIASAKWRGYFDPRNIVDILKFPLSLIQAFWAIYKTMPDAIFSKGGPGSLPVVIAGWFFRVPILIHESDSIPGKSNLIAAKFAKKIAVAFNRAKKYFPAAKTALVGQPIDLDFNQIEPDQTTFIKFGLDRTRPIILIIGGSQGSQKINDVALESLAELLNLSQIIHQTGRKNFEDARLIAQGYILENLPTKKSDYHPLAFIDHRDLIELIKMSDIIISRAGSSSIFEIAAAGKPSILVPLPETTSNRHQIENAYDFAETGAAVVIEQPNFNKNILVAMVKSLLVDIETKKSMSVAALKFAKLQAANLIAKELILLSQN